jgi:ribose transport system permease protein
MAPQTSLGRVLNLFAVSEVGVLCALVMAVALFSALEPAFLSERNLRAILVIVSFVGVIAVGQIVLLVCGEFDLSVGSVAGLAAVVSAKVMTALALPVPVALACGILVGALIGLVNGLVVVRLHVPAFIQTLGMLFIGQGLIQVVTLGYPVYPLPPEVSAIGQASVLMGLGWSFVFFALLAFAADFTLRRTTLGRNCYAVGGNVEVARLVGINTSRYKIGAFVFVGAMAAIAGMFVMADLASGTTSIGNGWELTVIAGVVVGGVSLFGGTGSVAGGLIGMLLLQVVQSGLVISGVSANWQQIAVGVIMVAAVGLDVWRRRVFVEGGRSEPEPSQASSAPRDPQPDSTHANPGSS